MSTAKKLVTSKKVWIFIIGIAVVILNRVLDIGLTGEDLEKIAGADIAALVSIGLADFGKERAKALVTGDAQDPISSP